MKYKSTIIFLCFIFFIILLWIIVSITSENKRQNAPPVYSGHFFKFKVDVVYKDRPMTIEYPVGCNFNVSRNIDGSRSYDGASISPSVFGVKTHDGGALVIKTPNFCDFRREIDKGEIPSSYNPLIVHYADAAEPTFGMGYYGSEAFDSPLSVLKFTSSNIIRVTGAYYVGWRDANPNINWVTHELMNADPRPFKRKEWLPGARHLATVCRGSIFSAIPIQYKTQINDIWYDLNKPYFWSAENHIVNLPKKEKYKNLRKNEIIYPSETDYDMNSIGEDGRIHLNNIIVSNNSYVKRDKIEKIGISENIVKDEKYKGFVFCNSHDWNHVSGISMKHAFEEYRAGIYQLNGVELKEQREHHPFGGLHGPFFEENKQVISNIKINFYGLGVTL